MRFTTYFGFIVGVVVIYAAVLAKGGDHTIFTNATALLIAVGGTFAATTLSSSRATLAHAMSAMRSLLWAKTPSAKNAADKLLVLARQARVQGLASLTPAAAEVGDPFFAQGLQLVADGVAPERIEELLRLESDILSEKRRAAERMFRLMGTYSPMFGLVGTLIGLITMLKGLSDPRAIGHGMSVALMATFYGVLLAGLLFLPLAGKIRTLDLDERLLRDQILSGLLAIRIGDNPEDLRETLEVFTQKRAQQ